MALKEGVHERSSEAGEIRVRNLIELAFVFLAMYVIFQVAPVVITRMNFLNELQVIAHSPVEEKAHVLQQKVLRAAEGRTIALNADNIHVLRDQATRKTTIDVSYDLHVNFFPRFTYVWRVRDHVEALLF
jgi:hypothetical protein